LKTLEEPPAYALFILATTEWHKVPATIVSRCQRFEFKRVATDVMTKRLEELARLEKWEVSPDVIKLIVSRADGFVRDAETLLGQLGSLGETKIDAELASLVIPPSHLPLAAGLMKLWADRNHPAQLKEAQRLFDEGIPVLPLFDDLLFIVRKLLVASGDPNLGKEWANGTEEERAIAELVDRFSPGELSDMALLLMERRRDIKSGVDALFALQLAGTTVACGLLKNSKQIEVRSVIASEVRRSAAISESEIASSPTPRNDKEEKTPPRNDKEEKTPPRNDKEEKTPPRNDKEEKTPPRNDKEEKKEGAIDLTTVRLKWNAIVAAVEEKNHSLPFILKICKPEAVEGATIVIRFQYPFHRDKIMNDVKNRRTVEECLRAVLSNTALIIEGVVGEDANRKANRSQDMVSNIISAFGGNVVDN